MTDTSIRTLSDSTVLTDTADAEGYIVSICFKNGPPRLVGLELEWTLHDHADPRAPLEKSRLRSALGPYAPSTLTPDSPHLLLDHGGAVTVEPGGQLEISTAPRASLARLVSDTLADTAQLDALLDDAGLFRGDTGLDAHRPPQLVLDSPRYRAMLASFDHDGPHGRRMMCSTASLQISLDAGLPDRRAARWSAVHAIGPVLLAAFANSPLGAAGRGWSSSRMQAWLGIDQARAGPVSGGDGSDPAADWARYALAAPLICRRRPGEDWSVPRGLTFADWIHHPGTTPPTTADLDYHLGTLFPPVRPQGHLELRYLDAQPGADWLAPAAILAGLNTDDALLDEAGEACDPVRHRWQPAARLGLADAPIRRAAGALADIACRAIAGTDLSPQQISAAVDTVQQRFHPEETS